MSGRARRPRAERRCVRLSPFARGRGAQRRCRAARPRREGRTRRRGARGRSPQPPPGDPQGDIQARPVMLLPNLPPALAPPKPDAGLVSESVPGGDGRPPAAGGLLKL